MLPDLFSYLLKLSLSLAMVYLFYRLVLQNLTFYHWNRWYLLLFTALCFVIPLFDIGDLWSGHAEADLPVVTRYIPPVEVMAGANLAPAVAASPAFEDWDLLAGGILIGIGVLLVKLGVQVLSFIRIRQTARLISNQGIRIYQVDADILPFSFGRSVFLNQALHRQQDLPDIIRHELVHVQQGHTMDVIWMELVCLLNWYNPFAWLLRSHLRQNLEYLADSQVLQAGIDKKQYQYLLLQVTGGAGFHLGQPFNFTSLKKRILMMNKLPSSRPQLARFLFLLPLLAVLLVAFRGGEKPENLPGQKVEERIVVSGKQAAAPVNKAQTSREGGQKFAVEQQSQSQLKPQQEQQLQQKQQLQQQKKQRQQQKRQLQQQQKQKQQLKQQNLNAVQREIIGRDSIRARRGLPDDYQSFMKRNPQVKGLSWQKEDKVVIHLKSGKQEAYDLKDAASLAALEKKYGKLPVPPPPPPAPPVPASPPPWPPAAEPKSPAAPAAPAAPAPQKLPPPLPPKTDNMGVYNATDPGRFPEDYKAFLKRNPQVDQLLWYWGGSGILNDPVQVVVIQKSGAQESYHYSSESDMARAEKKYGKLPWPAPPVARYDIPPGKIIEVPIDKPRGQE